MMVFGVWLGFLIVLAGFAYWRMRPLYWLPASGVLLTGYFFMGWQSQTVFTSLMACWFVLVLLAAVKPLRYWLVTAPIRQWFKAKQPPISAAEQVVLDAGGSWWETEVFSGAPNWKRLFIKKIDRLSDEEQAFLDGPVQTLCNMLNEWEINNKNKDLPKEAWDYIKAKRFWAICMDKRYGGLGFSHAAHSAIVTKVATCSISAAYTVMVPNSLGPAELIDYCGTEQQKASYLPRLATGEEIGCFGLTGLHAGSDAASVPDRGVVCRGQYQGQEVLGIRLNFDKRYITLAPVATLIGLAFRLFDPQHLLGGKEDIGITMALVPSTHPGVESGRRHSPLTLGFMNGPLRGRDVFIPLDWVIGGADSVGQGWKMLMGCLSVGRGISMPALSAAIAQQCVRLTGAYARIRRQFKRPVGDFEGVQEALAQVAGMGYLIEANRYALTQAVEEGARPSVAAGIAKYHLTELSRKVLQLAMDVHSGHALQAGPSNILAEVYNGVPVSTVGEGANIMTRNLIIFGQGVMRAHPYVRDEIMAGVNEQDEKKAVEGFDHYFFKHLGLAIGSWVRGIGYGWLGLSSAGVRSPLSKQIATINRMSNALLVVSDVALMRMGKALKVKESVSARLGDVLSYLYLATATVKYFHDHDQQSQEKDFAQWAVEYCLFQAARAFKLFFDNFSYRFLSGLMRRALFPTGLDFAYPADELGFKLARVIQQPSQMRKRLSAWCYVGEGGHDPIGRVERAWIAVEQSRVVMEKVDSAVKQRQIKRGLTRKETIEAAVEAQVISQKECQQLLFVEQQRDAALTVDAFAFNELLRFNAEVLEQVNTE